MELIPGVSKEDYSDYVLYFIEYLSDELKLEIRNRLVAVCHGANQTQSSSKIYSYRATVKDFIKRCKTDSDAAEDRKKGMIGELLVHIILEMEGHFTTASPFFNMEEQSFKKGFDIALFEPETNELWITEVKAGKKQKNKANASSAIVGLINNAKNDLKGRLNTQNTSLWLNALTAARVSMSNGCSQKDAVIKLLEQCADDAIDENVSSNSFNVVLAATLFHPMTERMTALKVGQKYSSIIKENLFKKVLVIAIQKGTFEAVYDFLESEANDEV